MNLVPDLEKIADKRPRRRPRRWGKICVVQLGVVVVALSAPEGHQEEGEETQSNSDTRQRGTRILLDGQSLKLQFHIGR